MTLPNDRNDSAHVPPTRLVFGAMACLFALALLAAIAAPAIITVQHMTFPNASLAKLVYGLAYWAVVCCGIVYIFGSVSLFTAARSDSNRRLRAVTGFGHATLPFLILAGSALVIATGPYLNSPQLATVDPLWTPWVAAAALLAIPGIVTAAKAWLMPETDEQAHIEKPCPRCHR